MLGGIAFSIPKYTSIGLFPQPLEQEDRKREAHIKSVNGEVNDSAPVVLKSIGE